MKYSPIKPNQIRSNGLDFYDNPYRYEYFHVGQDDNLKVPLQFKGTKCTFLSHVLTQLELGTCQHFEITSDHKWDPQYIDLNMICKISKFRRLKRSVFRVQPDTVYL